MPNQGREKVPLESRPGAGYEEDAFLYFLAKERARAGRLNHPLGLLLATLEPAPGERAPISPASAARLFEGLRSSLRETDVVGWYRQDRVVSAILSARGETPVAAMAGAVEVRVVEKLRQRLPAKVARSLRVRVLRLGQRAVGNA